MGLLEPTHLLLIGLAVLLLFGPKKIPELMRGLGKGMGELQKGINEGKAALHSAMNEIEHHTSAESTPEPEKVNATTPGTAAAPNAVTQETHTATPEDHPVKSA